MIPWLRRPIRVCSGLLRPCVDRLVYNAIARSVAQVPPGFPRSRLPFAPDIPFQSFLSPAYALGVIGSRSDLDVILAQTHFGLCFPERKANSELSRGAPSIVDHLSLGTLAALGLVEIADRSALIAKSRGGEIFAAIGEALAAGKYVLCSVNEYYVKGSANYRRMDAKHPLLLAGWDPANDSFIGLTYISDGAFGEISLPRSALITAMVSNASFGLPYFVTPKHRAPNLQLVTPRVDRVAAIRADRVAEQLMRYLASRPPSVDCLEWLRVTERGGRCRVATPSYACAYGPKAFDLFGKYFELLASRKMDPDMRVSRVFWEHKEIMIRRLRYLGALGWLEQRDADAYETVRQWAHFVHLYTFAWRNSPDGTEGRAEMLAAAAEWREMKAAETKILERVLSRLKAVAAKQHPARRGAEAPG